MEKNIIWSNVTVLFEIMINRVMNFKANSICLILMLDLTLIYI